MIAKLADIQLWQRNLASLIRSGLFRDIKKGRFYEKPSEAKKRKAAAARRRNARVRRYTAR